MSATSGSVDLGQAGHRRVVVAALDAEDRAHQERRRAEREQVDGEAGDDRVAPQVDDHERRRRATRASPRPAAATTPSAGWSVQAVPTTAANAPKSISPSSDDVEDAGALGEHAAQGREQDRRHDADRGCQQRDVEDHPEVVHPSVPSRRPTQRPSTRRIEIIRMIAAWTMSTIWIGMSVRRSMPAAPTSSPARKRPANRLPMRVRVGQQRRREPGPGVAGPGDGAVDVAVVDAEHENRAGEPADRAADEHRAQDRPAPVHAAVLRERAGCGRVIRIS